MGKKATLEQEHAQLKLHTQRIKVGYGPETTLPIDEINTQMSDIEQKISTLDERIRPLAKIAQEIFNPRWGLLTPAGFDKSYLARQLEGYADV